MEHTKNKVLPFLTKPKHPQVKLPEGWETKPVSELENILREERRERARAAAETRRQLRRE